MDIHPSPRGVHKVGFAAGFLTAVLLFLTLLATKNYATYFGVQNQRAAGLAGFDHPMALWNSSSIWDVFFQRSLSQHAMFYSMYAEPAEESRRIIKSGNLQIEAAEPVRAAEQIQQIAKALGGELFKSNLADRLSDKPQISLEIRVPSNRFDEARAQIRDLGYRLDFEQIETRDVGKEYVDLDATLRNEEAKESQYLSILKRASTVHDTLEVSEHLSEVRGTIEKTKGELQYLARQIETSALDITIVGEERLGPLSLHPLYRIKFAVRNAVSSVVDFGAAMIMVVSYFPAALLWMVSLFLLAALTWRIVRWLWKLLSFKTKEQVAA